MVILRKYGMPELRGKRSEHQLQFHRPYEQLLSAQEHSNSFLPGAETWNRTLTPFVEVQKTCRILHKKPFLTARQDGHFINCTMTQSRTWLSLAMHPECLRDAQKENFVSFYNTDFWEYNGYRGRKHWEVLPTPTLREAVVELTFLYSTLCHWQPH